MPGTAAISTDPFPVNGLLPKESTEALTFLRKYPNYDGRNIRVAILDTGVDPAALGLNSSGKVVDLIDCSGSGDVPLQPIQPEKDVESSGDQRTISFKSPFTDRTIKISSDIKNPSGQWKVGCKKAYDLWPDELVKRRTAERKAAFIVSHQALLCKSQSELLAFESSEKDKAKGSDSSKDTKENDNIKLKREELKAKVQALKDLESSYVDVGPIIEAIVFHDGKHWRALVGGGEGEARDSSLGQPDDFLRPMSTQVVDLTQCKALTDFRVERQWDTFGAQDMLTYSVNIVDDGAMLSLVSVAGSHGTHVAGIVGARHDEEPELNGVAPGCEIVSLKIGDSRLGSMEAGQALLRAAQAILDTGCHIANMSYGENGAFGVENKGAFAEALRDVVIRKRDVLFISSAGNAGPALSTVGQPGGTTSGVLSVGAYVNAGAMQKAEYALVEKGVQDSVTTWCSRGPCADGERGVSIYAPGAAITSVPKYIKQSSQLMNGTSMSSPNACGSIALLLSGMLDKGIPLNPHRVFKAIRATAKDVGDPLGVGFIRVDAAWDYIVDNQKRDDQDAEFRVAITPPGKPPGRAGSDKRGIYLREKAECYKVQQYNVAVQPTFKQHEGERAFALELRCALTSTQPWVKTPEFLLLGGNGRSFEVRVDPTLLPPGLHHASIEAYDTAQAGFKLFDIPVTIAKPEIPDSPTVRYSSRLESGKIERHFVSVPEGSTWASITIRSSNHSAPGTTARFWLHCVQMEKLKRLSDVEKAFVLSLSENEPVTKKFSVSAGTMEICSAQFWSSKAGFDLDLEIEFHGIATSLVSSAGREELTLIGGQGLAKIECLSNIRVEDFRPSVSFDTRRTFARPVESIIRPLLERDMQPSGRRMMELITTYKISASDASNKVTYSFPALGSHLYDSAVPLLTQLFDLNKKRVHFGDVYPKEIDLPKGDYTLKAQFLHESIEVLEKLKNVTLTVDQKLSKPKDACLEIYHDQVDVHSTAKPPSFNGVKLQAGERIVLCLSTNLEGDQLPKEAQPGDVLIGTLSFAAEGKSKLRYIVPPAPKKEKGDETPQKETIPDLLTAAAKKIKEKQEKLKFIDKLAEEYPTHLPLQLAKLEALDADDKQSSDDVHASVDKILALIDENELKLWMATSQPSSSELSEEQIAKNKEMEERKKALILSLNRKARASLVASDGKGGEAFETIFAKYREYFSADSKDKDFVSLYTKWSILHERYAISLLAVQKLKKELGAGTSESIDELKKARALEKELVGKGKLGWDLWEGYLDRKLKADSQADFAPF